MTVLVKRETWRRSSIATVDRAEPTPEERANLRRALRFLRVRVGSGVTLAALLRVSKAALTRATGGRPRGSAVVALRAARLAGASVEDVLGGAWPPEGACAHCGRTG